MMIQWIRRLGKEGYDRLDSSEGDLTIDGLPFFWGIQTST